MTWKLFSHNKIQHSITKKNKILILNGIKHNVLLIIKSERERQNIYMSKEKYNFKNKHITE